MVELLLIDFYMKKKLYMFRNKHLREHHFYTLTIATADTNVFCVKSKFQIKWIDSD